MVNLTEKICVVCNKVYYRKRKEALTSKYCSRACQAIGKRGRTFTERTCESCGKTFSVLPSQLNHRHVRYCSTQCSADAKKNRPTETCLHCGEQFLGFKSRKRNYCSRVCYLAHHKAPLIKKTCPVCRKEFEVVASYADRYTVCSLECRRAETVYVTCKRCGKLFTGKRHQNLSYCSEACRRPPRLISCATCGKRFRVTPGSTIKYCSRRCFRSFRGETSLEAQVREAIESLNIPFKQEFHISRYRVDFAFPGRGLILEVDGAYWHRDQAKDARRSKALEELGWRVVRINENEITEAANLATLLGDKFRESLLLESTQAVLPLFQTELSQD